MPESMPAKETNACVQVACENGGALEEHDGSPAGCIPCCMFPRSCGDGALDEGRIFAVFSDEARASFLSARGRLQVSSRHPKPLNRTPKPYTPYGLLPECARMSAGGAIQKGGGGAAASGAGAASEAGQPCLPGAAVCRRGPPDRAGHQVPRLQEPQEEGRRVHAHGLRLRGALLLRVWGGPVPRCPGVVCCGCRFPPWPLGSRLSAEALLFCDHSDMLPRGPLRTVTQGWWAQGPATDRRTR